MKNRFFKYVSQNILAMIGLSLYILADTYFISKAVGANGITALNMALPVYGVIFALGQMVGVGSAIRYSIVKEQYRNSNKDGSNECDKYFSGALFWGLVIGVIFAVLGLVFPDKIVEIMGGDETIVAIGVPYFRIFMSFSPFFIFNYTCNAFVRNDGNPSVSMAATLISSLFNIVFDYILMFPLGMGMPGAALATALSPVVGVMICMIHFLSKKNTVKFKWFKTSLTRLFHCCQVGMSAFVGEMSGAVIVMVFNFIILRLTGNIGVAAYGVVANTALVAVAVFNGVALGSQPLISESYGKHNIKDIKLIEKLGVATALGLAVIIVIMIWGFTDTIVGVFNSQGSDRLLSLARVGLRIYFIGFLFAGINIFCSSALSAIASVKWAFVLSILKGFVVVNVCAGRQFGAVVLCGPVQILIVAARKAEAHGNGQKQRHGNLCDSFHGVCSVPFLNIADKMSTKVCCCSLYRRYGKMSSYFVAGFGAFASSSPQRTFKTSSKTVSGALPPSATLMYGRLPAESITLFGMP